MLCMCNKWICSFDICHCLFLLWNTSDIAFSNWGTLAAPFCPSDNGVSSTKRPHWKRGDCEVRQNRWWIFGISWIDGFRLQSEEPKCSMTNAQKCTIRYNVHSFLANANSTTSYVKNKSSCLNWHPNHHQLLSFPTGDGRNLMGIFQWNLQPFVQQFSSMKLPPRLRLALCLGYDDVSWGLFWEPLGWLERGKWSPNDRFRIL